LIYLKYEKSIFITNRTRTMVLYMKANTYFSSRYALLFLE